MANEEVSKAAEHAKELLLLDYKYAQESFWKSESLGEVRVNILIGIVTGVTAGIFALLSAGVKDEGRLSELSDDVIFLSGFALAALFLLGLITLLRLMKRNEVTDGLKDDMDDIRKRVREQYAAPRLDDYFPFGSKPSNDPCSSKRRKFGGLVHLVALLNSFVGAGFTGVLIVRTSARPFAVVIIILAFLTLFGLQCMYVWLREGNKH